jgi:hypothetical protein
MEASCGRSGGPAQPLDEQDPCGESNNCPPNRLDLDEKQDGRRRGHHRGQLDDSGGLAGDGNHEEYHRGRDSRQTGEERKSMIAGGGVGARRVAFGSFAADILHVDLEGLEVRGDGRVRGTRLEEGAQGKAAERTRAREEGPAAAGEGFETTRGEGFEACGKSFEACEKSFEARGEGFEARGKGFEARGKGFDGARGEGLTQLSDKMPATPDSGYSTGLSTPG